MIKLFGALVLLFSIKLIISGIKFKDTGHGAKLANINLIGAGLILFILGIAFILTDRSFCEIFGILC
jgi:hypothetical protein